MQLSYSSGIDSGLPGDPAYGPGTDSSIQTYNNPSDVIPWGVGVAKIAGDEDGVKLLDDASDKFIGISRRDNTTENTSYAVKSAVGVQYRGAIRAQVEEAVTPDDSVYVRFRSDPHVVDVQFSGALITGNTVNGTVNGTAIAAVPFDTDNATTLTNLATALEALDEVDTAVSDGVDTITITGANGGEVLVVSLTVTGGLSQATASQSTVSGPSSGTQAGAFRTDDDDTGTGAAAFAVPQARFDSSTSGAGVAAIDLNLP